MYYSGTYKNTHTDILYHHFTDTMKQWKNVVAQCRLSYDDIVLNTDVDIHPLPDLLVSSHVHRVDCSTRTSSALQKLHQTCRSVTLSALISTVALALALQKVIGGSSRDHLFGVQVKFVANASLEQMHKTCLERSAVCTSFERGACRRFVSHIRELRYLHRRQPHLSEKGSRATAAQWAPAIPPSCSAARRTFKK